MKKIKTAEEKLKDFKKSNISRRIALAKKEGYPSVEEYFVDLVWNCHPEGKDAPKKEEKRGFNILRFIRGLFGYDKKN